MNDIGNRLSDLLASHDMSQRELSKAIGVGHVTINRIVRFGDIPNGKTLIALADYFVVSIDWLVGRE